MALTSLVVSCAAGPDAAGLEGLYRAHRWLELRDVVTDRSPALFRGAVAAAFNEPARAEALLREVLRSQPRSSAADDAYALLSQVFIRSGQYGRFLATYGEWATAFPASAGVQRERESLDSRSGMRRPD
jgi:hypothetical protein